MTALAPTLQAYFTDRLIGQRRVSPNTVASYRDAFRLLLVFVHDTTGTPPARLELTQLDAPTIGAFLEHLERDRGNSARTRNIRLAAVHSLFHYCGLRHPEHAALIQRVLAIPPKRTTKRNVTFLTPEEVQALLAAPDRTTWAGRRDHALLLTAVQTGLRVSELLGLTHADAQFGAGAHLRTTGKGRKQRVAPLTRPDRRGAAHLGARERRPADRPVVRLASRRAADPRRDRTPPRQARRDRAARMSDASQQARLDARAAPHLRDEPPHRWRRHRHDRTLARPRAGTHDPSTCMPTSSTSSAPWTASHPPRGAPAATARPTRCSPSSRICSPPTLPLRAERERAVRSGLYARVSSGGGVSGTPS
jgi:site-specific recombinase XerD